VVRIASTELLKFFAVIGNCAMGKKILVVDDSSSVRSVVKSTLVREGYDVDDAADGKLGLEKAQGGRYDLIISDVNMPNMDGITMVKEIKKLASMKFVSVCMLTTESEQSKIAEGKAAGVKAWIVKPFDAGKLLAAVKQLVR
jgi:two-component system chemotaxis response regulator CheY